VLFNNENCEGNTEKSYRRWIYEWLYYMLRGAGISNHNSNWSYDAVDDAIKGHDHLRAL
jgi:hypothetical protein